MTPEQATELLKIMNELNEGLSDTMLLIMVMMLVQITLLAGIFIVAGKR